MILFWAGIALVALGGILQLFLPERKKAVCVAAVAAPGIAMLLYVAVSVLLSGNSLSLSPAGVFSLDRLSAFFVAVISLMSFTGLCYATGYMKSYEDRSIGFSSHFVFLCLLVVSMILTAVARHAVAFLVCWELMSLSSFFLVVFDNGKEEVYKAGILYFTMMHVSVVLLMLGFGLASAHSGSFYFSSYAAAAGQNPGVSAGVFLLLFAGFAIKAGLVPTHTWLPSAHPAAPSHVSGIMSGVMIKLGIYGILRAITFTWPLPEWIAYLVLASGLVSSLLGVMYAIAQHDMKRLLAYSSVENIGIIGIGIGLGMLGLSSGNAIMAFLGFAGAILHVLNHSIFKELLFYGAGAVQARTGSRNIDSLGGLAGKMPRTSLCFLTGSIAITGLPPLNGFISEFLIFLAMIQAVKTPAMVAAGGISFAALAFTGTMALLCFTKIYGTVFLGSPRSVSSDIAPGEDRTMTLTMIVLAVFCCVIGFLPWLVLRLVAGPAVQMLSAAGYDGVDWSFVTSVLQKLSIGFVFMTASVVFLHFMKKKFLRHKTRKQPTWGCGYSAPEAGMQYTATSYAAPFLKLSGPLLKKEEQLEKPEGLFPVKASFKSHVFDVFDLYLLKPVAGSVIRVLKLFSRIQTGSMQLYILYGIIFLVLSIVWVLGAW